MKKPSKKSLKTAVLAQCHQCMGYWHDGHSDCQNTVCSLYHWMPYRKLEPDYEWLEYNPRRKGKVKWENIPQREYTEEQLEALRARMLKMKKGAK